MSTTVMDALRNANYNINGEIGPLGMTIGKEQLGNAMAILQKGYELDEDIDALVERFGAIESIPDKTEADETILVCRIETLDWKYLFSVEPNRTFARDGVALAFFRMDRKSYQEIPATVESAEAFKGEPA